MNITDVQVGKSLLLEVRRFDGSRFEGDIPKKSELTLRPSRLDDEALLIWKDRTWEVVGNDGRHHAQLLELVGTSHAHLCWLISGGKSPDPGSDVLTIQVRRFLETRTQLEPIVIGVADMVIDKIRQSGMRGQSAPVTEIVDWLNERLIMGQGAEARILTSTSPRPYPGLQRAFRLYGDGLVADVGRDPAGDWRVTAVARLHPSALDEQRSITIMTGPIRFDDATAAGRYRNRARTELDEIAAHEDSYLKLWQKYNGIEQRNILRRAREFGWLKYTKCQQLQTGEWRFKLREEKDEREGLEDLAQRHEVDLEAGSQPPQSIAPEDDAEAEAVDVDEVEQSGRRRFFVGECLNPNPERYTLDIRPLEADEEIRPPEHGFLYMALHGDQLRLARRETAWRRIRNAQVPIPWLGQLLEGQATPYREQPRLRKFPSKILLRELFGSDPTPKQLEALNVALTTPDIALIQGPPGTGKTKVIAALEAILAKVESDAKSPKRSLLTSFQHDAVEHAASQTKVLGLPAVKVGRRRGRPGLDDGDEWIEKWRHEQAESVSVQLATLPEQPLARAMREVEKRKLAYDRKPGTDAETAQLLREVLDLTETVLPGALRSKLIDQYQRLYRPVPTSSTGRDNLLVEFARRLRTQAAGFQDDGPAQAVRLLTYAEVTGADIPETEAVLLREAAAWRSDETPSFLAELAELQSRLVERWQAPSSAIAAANLENREVKVLLTEVGDALYARAREHAPGIELTLEELVDDLTEDPLGVRNALEAYTAVLASTCQQVDGRQMQLRMGETEYVFHTVIVDEAARANPLDLFIPMARAERRIILVGDHRQLPQILDMDVERELEASTASTQEQLRDSLFHRLFQDLKKRQEQDGQTRTVTLDKQYRMHPVLGRFVSDTFYAPYDEAFESALPAAQFEHAITPYQGKVAAWIDVPRFRGYETGGQSKKRSVEARRVADEVHRILEEYPEYTVGVITFYSAQVGALLKELARAGAVIETDDGLEVKDKGRLRVGTVDAFQGMEFDIVILSLTRSNDLPMGERRAMRRKFGFLTVENRMCVAMSRQKRLLIVVGDAAMAEAAKDQDELRGLSAFWALCGGEYGLRL